MQNPKSDAAPGERAQRFVHHGATCEADKFFPDEVVRCGEPAVDTVHDRGLDRYVCGHHRKLWREAHSID